MAFSYSTLSADQQQRFNQALGYAYGYADAKKHAVESGTGAAISNANDFAEFCITHPAHSLQDSYKEWDRKPTRY